MKAIGGHYSPPRGIDQSFEIALWLPRFADVDAEYERLSALGARFLTGAPGTDDFGIRNFYVANPQGNLLAIGSTSEMKFLCSSIDAIKYDPYMFDKGILYELGTMDRLLSDQ